MRNITSIGKNYFFKNFEVEILAPPGVLREETGYRFPTPRGLWAGKQNPYPSFV